MRDMIFAGMAPSISILLTSPIDVVKARMQVHGEGIKVSFQRTAFGELRELFQKEGLSGCYRGLGISIMREASLNVMRLGLYDPIMSLMHTGYYDMASTKETGLPPLYKRLLCGSICGIMGSVASSPMELIKCRMQCGGESAAAGHKYKYTSAYDACTKIIRSEGVKGLWNGAEVFVMRNAIGSAANLSTFSAFKAYFLNFREDSVLVDVAAGLASGFVTTCVMCPLDMIKTRLQNQPVDELTGKGRLYRHGGDAVAKIVKSEGTFALYKGFSSLFVRTGPHYVLTFAIYGLLKRWASSKDNSDGDVGTTVNHYY
eukprot:jgi/Bigna1/46386/estExt_Genewise1.C_40095